MSLLPLPMVVAKIDCSSLHRAAHNHPSMCGHGVPIGAAQIVRWTSRHSKLDRFPVEVNDTEVVVVSPSNYTSFGTFSSMFMKKVIVLWRSKTFCIASPSDSAEFLLSLPNCQSLLLYRDTRSNSGVVGAKSGLVVRTTP
jgi:hypothetical protein